jgi:Family of unknown function (DUF6152)
LSMPTWKLNAATRGHLCATGARRRVSSLARTMLLALAMTSPTFAHHSYAAFDMSKQVEFQGTVKSFLWTNPHSLLIMSVTGADGKTADCSIEMNGPGYLVRDGWKRDSVKAGDKITATVHPLRDGSRGGTLVKVVFSDGRSLSADAKPPGLLVPGGTAPQGNKP